MHILLERKLHCTEQLLSKSMEEDPWKQEDSIQIPNIPQVVQVLEALKQASQNIQQHHHLHHSNSPPIKALFQLQTTILSNHHHHHHHPNLSQHLHNLKSLIDSNSNPTTLKSFITRPLSTHSISKLAASIESELQAWIDREITQSLSVSLNDVVLNENELLPLLTHFTQRLGKGFNRDLQELILNYKLFSSLESILCDAKCSQRIREHVALAIAALIRFNKDVFVGQVLMGPTIRALVTIASVTAVDVLCSLVRLIRSPIVDEIESNGEIGNIIALLNSRDLELRVLGMECVLEIGYFGRKEAVEGMLKEGVVEKLMELQRDKKEGLEMERDIFGSCVARFAVQLEVGEGLRQREKRGFKSEILVRVRESSVSDAEAATVVSEVLWGTSI